MTHEGFQLRLIGPPAILGPSGPARLPRRKALALLAYLLGRRQPVARERLAAMLWPDSDEAQARTSLRRVLSDLGAVLGRDWLVEDEGGLAPAAGLALGSDVERLERLLGRASGLPLDAYDPWMRDGMAPFMEGFELPGLELWGEWRYVEAEALRTRQRELAARACAAAQAAGDAGRALAWSRAWRLLDPLDEAALRAELRALALGGEGEALAGHYAAFALQLRLQLDIAPEPRTRALLEELRAGEAGAPGTAKPADWERAPVRYTRVGELYLASRVVGDRGPWLVLVNGFVSHLEYLERDPGLSAFAAAMARDRRLLLFDKRGMGLSDRTGSPPTPERTAADLLALMDAHGIGRAIVMGVSEGGPAALQAARLAPGRVTGLVLYGTAAKWVAAPDYAEAIPAAAYARWIDRLQRHWGDATSVADFAPTRAGDPATVRWWSQLLRAAASPGTIRAILEAAADVDCRPWLSELRVPALVLHRRDDRMLRVGNGRWLAAALPRASYVELAGADHWFWSGDTAPMLEAIGGFVDALARDAPGLSAPP